MVQLRESGLLGAGIIDIGHQALGRLRNKEEVSVLLKVRGMKGRDHLEQNDQDLLKISSESRQRLEVVRSAADFNQSVAGTQRQQIGDSATDQKIGGPVFAYKIWQEFAPSKSEPLCGIQFQNVLVAPSNDLLTQPNRTGRTALDIRREKRPFLNNIRLIVQGRISRQHDFLDVNHRLSIVRDFCLVKEDVHISTFRVVSCDIQLSNRQNRLGNPIINIPNASLVHGVTAVQRSWM